MEVSDSEDLEDDLGAAWLEGHPRHAEIQTHSWPASASLLFFGGWEARKHGQSWSIQMT